MAELYEEDGDDDDLVPGAPAAGTIHSYNAATYDEDEDSDCSSSENDGESDIMIPRASSINLSGKFVGSLSASWTNAVRSASRPWLVIDVGMHRDGVGGE